MWDLRKQVRAQLDERLPALQRRAAQTAPLIAELLDERKDPEDVISSWQALELAEHAPAASA
jgi:hypothetical protein